MSGMKYTLFAYGTLRKDEVNHGCLGGSVCLGMDYIQGFMMLDLGQYPMAFETGDNSKRILVEIYEIDEKTLNDLDLLEEYEETDPESLYRRKIAESVSGLSGLIYYGKNINHYEQFRMITGGDWKKR